MDNGLKASCRSKGEVLMCYVDNFTRTTKESNEQPRTGGVVVDTTTDTPQSKEAVSRTCSRKRMILMPFSNRQHKICNSRMSKRNRQRTSCTSQTPTRSTPVPPRGGTHRISDRYFVIFFLQQSAGTGRQASAIDPDPPSPHISALDSTILSTTKSLPNRHSSSIPHRPALAHLSLRAFMRPPARYNSEPCWHQCGDPLKDPEQSTGAIAERSHFVDSARVPVGVASGG